MLAMMFAAPPSEVVLVAVPERRTIAGSPPSTIEISPVLLRALEAGNCDSVEFYWATLLSSFELV